MSINFPQICRLLFKFEESEVYMDINMESIGDRIKNRRKEMQLTQTDIFNICGIRSGALSRIENGTSVPSVILFYKISQVLECDMQWLLTGVSSNMEIPVLSKKEEILLEGFQKLSEYDQEEIIAIINIKLQRARKSDIKSSTLTETNDKHLAG